MRKIILLGFMFCTLFGFSQEIKYGFKAGLNLSSLRGDYPTNTGNITFDNKSKIGFNIGGFAEYKINNKFSLQPELLISTQGGIFETKYNYHNNTYGDYYEKVTQTTKLTNLNLPILLKYYVMEKLSLEFGPQIGFVVGAKIKLDYVDSTNSSNNETIELNGLQDGTFVSGGQTYQYKKGINTVDFSLNFGTTYNLTKNLFVQGRYNLGLSKVDKNSTNGSSTNSWNMKNSVFQLSAGYKF